MQLGFFRLSHLNNGRSFGADARWNNRRFVADTRLNRALRDELRRVLTGRNIDSHLVSGALSFVEFPQAFPEPVGLYANDRIAPLVEIGRTAESFNGNVVFFDLFRRTFKIFFANVRQDVRKIRRAMEDARVEDRLEFVPLLFVTGRSRHDRSTETLSNRDFEAVYTRRTGHSSPLTLHVVPLTTVRHTC